MKPRVAIVDYKMGNIFSLVNALETSGADVVVTNQPKQIRAATHLVLPGDGAFQTGMANLKRFGLISVLEEEVLEKKKPFLGICVGMQILAKEGTENENCRGLNWVRGKVILLEAAGKKLPLPHIGWNDITYRSGEMLFDGIVQQADFYFIHSYHFVCQHRETEIARCDYGEKFTAALRQDNIVAVQFHPEKSQKYGIKLLKNFLEMNNA